MQTKPPPHDIDAEEAILGAMFLNAKTKPKIKFLLSSEDFYREAHQYIFDALLDTESDLISVSSLLKERNLLKKAGGSDYLAEIVNTVSTSAGFEYHCKIVKDLSQRRQIIGQCADTANGAWDLTRTTEETLSRHKGGIRGIEIEGASKEKTNEEIMNNAYDLIKSRSRGESDLGVPTGLESIDKRIFGLEKQCTYYVAAKRSTGKSAFAINVGMNVQAHGTVLFFSLESTGIAIGFRQIARETGIHLTRIKTGNIKDEYEWETLNEARGKLAKSQFRVIDSSRFQSLESLYAYCETVAMDQPLSLVVVDYIQLMSSKGKFNNRHLELSNISKLFNFLAKDLDCPVMVLSQLNKENVLKESGDIENNADNVWVLEKPAGPQSLYVKITATKGKDSGTWSEWLKFNQGKMTFSDCNPMDVDEALAEETVAKENNLDKWKI